MKNKYKFNIEKKNNLEMIFVIGRPGSGKSTFSKKILNTKGFENYVYVNQDECKTKNICMKKIKNAIKNNKNILIDNTHPDKNSRKEYIQFAKNNNLFVKVYIMDVSENLAKHLNHMRLMKGGNKKKFVPEIAYRIYNKKYEKPIFDEGIDEIIEIPFMYINDKNNDKYFLYHYTF
jgi:bifunctional polynucleotide phosphatase/kinase